MERWLHKPANIDQGVNGAEEDQTVNVKNVRRFDNKEKARNKISISSFLLRQVFSFFLSQCGRDKTNKYLPSMYCISDTMLRVGIKR